MNQKVSKSKLITVIAGCFCLMISSSVVSNSQSYFLTTVRDYLGCTAAQFSLYYSFVQICTVITSLCIGIIMAKVNRRLMLAVGAIGTALGFLILSQTQALWMVYAGAILVGFFQALIVVPPVQILNDWMPDGAGIGMGIVMSATGFGGIIMAQIMPRIVANVSWRTGYLVCGVMYIFFTILGIIFAGGKAPEQPEAALEAKSGKRSKSFAMVAKDPMFWVFIVLCFIGNGASNIDQHLSPIMQTKGFTVEMIAGAMTLFNIALLIFKISQGAMYKKVGHKFVLIYAVIGIFGYLLMQLSGSALYIGIVFKAFVGAGITVIYSLVCNEYFGTKFGGAVWGFAWAGFQFGATVFSPIYGSFLDKYGNYDRSTYIGAVITLIVGGTFYWMLKHKRADEEESAEISETE